MLWWGRDKDDRGNVLHIVDWYAPARGVYSAMGAMEAMFLSVVGVKRSITGKRT